MKVVSLTGDFSVNGRPSVGMEVATSQPVRFNIASGLVAVVATNAEGKIVKGIAVAEQGTLDSIQQLGNVAVRDESIRVPVFA